MKTFILSVLLFLPFAVFAQDFDEDNPPPSSQPPSSAAADGVIWEEEYIPQTPTAPPDGPTKLPPRSVRIQAEVLTIQPAAPTDDALAARLQIKLEQDLRLNKTQARRGDTVQVDLMENLKVQRGATLPNGESRSVQPRTLNDVTVGAKCTLIGHQRRDGVTIPFHGYGVDFQLRSKPV